MKKNIILTAIFATIFTSCALEPLFENAEQAGTTNVTFTVDFSAGDETPDTKAFTEKPQNVRNLYLAVFNEGGKALVEYVKADPVTLATDNEPQKYTYTVRLKTTTDKRVIHFIANAPEEIGYGSDVDAVGTLIYNFDTTNWTGEDAYWGYLELNDGICDEKDSKFSTLTAALSSVKLVRNFAKIKVEKTDDSNLTITRFWISNFPETSTAAPYNRETRRFETDYAEYDYATDAMTAGYKGFCPVYSGLVSLSGLSDTALDAIACGPETERAYAYTYEREEPVKDPLCIIVEGTTTDLSPTTKTFYKIDLRDNDGNYLPILRNFTYTIKVGTVYKVGEPTVEAALNSVSSGALDTDISLQDLKDLSNGKSRIAVNETERVLFEDEPFYLLYSYIPDITTGTVVNKTLEQWVSEGTYTDTDAVLAAHEPYVSIESEYGLSGNVIDSYSVSNIDETDGYRKVTIEPVPTSDIIKTEVVTITGHVWNTTKNGYETLQRKVTYYMRPRLDMVLTLTPDRVPAAVGESITLTIGIEENLPQSLFTLDMKITTEQMTLTPGSNGLPITSEVGADGKPAFFVTKAITWEEYSATPSVMDADGIMRKHFDCPFKTNTNNFRPVDSSFGQGDRVLVSNENFNTGNTLFIVGNDNLKRFINPHLNKEYMVAGRPADIIFGMTKLPSDGIIKVRLMGMEPNGSDLTWVEDETSGENAGYSVYTLHVTNASSESFSVKTKTGASTAYFQLFKEDEFNNSAKYRIPIQLASFTDLQFTYKNLDYVVAGKVAQATFHMDYIPLDGVVTIHLKNAVPVDNTITGTPEANGYTAYVIPATTSDVSFPVKIDPASPSETKAYFKLSAVNYNNSVEASSTIQKLNFSNLQLINVNNSGLNYVVGGKPARISFTLDDLPSDNVITIELTNLALGSGKTGISGIVDNGDGTYDLTVTGTAVTLDVTPTVGQTSASYELSDTEFNTNNCSATIKKLSFNNTAIVNVSDPSKSYVSEGKPARVSFTLEDMPADGTITLNLTNLTLDSTDPTSGKMSGISAISGSAGVYVLTVSSKTVTIDVTPAVNVTTAKFKLTDAEFYDAERTTDVRKLSFSNLKFTVNTTPSSYLLAGDATSTISFTIDGLPMTGNVTLWIKNASVNGLTPADEPVNGYTPYTVPVTDLVTTLGITVNNSGFTATNKHVSFYVRGTGIADSNEVSKEVKIRYTIDWSKVQIKTDDPNAVAKDQSVKVYRNDATCSGTPIATFDTDGSGMASGTDYVLDAANGTTDKFYFKFTKNNDPNNGVDYISAAVDLEDIADQNSTVTVTCIIQMITYTIEASSLYLTVGGKAITDGHIYIRLNSNSASANVADYNTTNGYNPTFTIRCKKDAVIYVYGLKSNNKHEYVYTQSIPIATLDGATTTNKLTINMTQQKL